MKVLITGGAGFIGSHLTRELLSMGQQITILDNFLPQVHGDSDRLAPDIAPHVELFKGDIADTAVLKNALKDVEWVVHLAAETGTGQSMYEVCRYERTNLGGSAALYQCLAETPDNRVERIVMASSRAIYGEGAYLCERDGIVYPISRSTEEKRRGEFDPVCPKCSSPSTAVPTPETATLLPS